MSAKKRILVVDDEVDYATIVKENLEKEGFEVELAFNGEEALEKTKANPPDAIVLDVMMPERDGYSVCSELKADKRYSAIPIVMLTCVASKVPTTRYSHYDGMIMEAEDYIPKPASAERIIQSIKRLLNI